MARVEGIGTALMTRTTKVASAVLQSHSHAKPEVVLKGLFGALLNAIGMQAQVSRSGHPTIDYGQTYVYQLVLRLG